MRQQSQVELVAISAHTMRFASEPFAGPSTERLIMEEVVLSTGDIGYPLHSWSVPDWHMAGPEAMPNLRSKFRMGLALRIAHMPSAGIQGDFQLACLTSFSNG